MKAYITLIALIMCLIPHLWGQDITHSVISSNGGVASNTLMTLEWTIGELAVKTYTGKGEMYTEGFHQPVLKIEPMDDELISVRTNTTNPEEDYGVIRVIPNPVSSMLNIEFELNEETEMIVQINDLNGKLLKSEKVKIGHGSLIMDFSSFASGIYIMKVTSVDGRFIKSCKISKI